MDTAAGLVGRQLGRYRVLARIGAGGMGLVFRAHDERLQRDVAIKVLPAGAVEDESARRRLRREALTLSRIAHPNVATVLDFDTVDGVDFLVAELIAGAPLDSALPPGRTREEDIAAAGLHIAAGLHAAHERGVIHRDLKPANIMMTPDGQVKIVDFGIAFVTAVAEAEHTATVTSLAAAGTLPYMSPEQLRGDRVDVRTDIWSAGCVLYEIALGRRPFQAPTTALLTDRILHADASLPRSIRPDLTPQFEFVLQKCLEKQPELRYQSARELETDLRRIASARVHTPAVQPGPVKRFGWWRLAAASAALAAVAGAAALVYLRRDPPPAIDYQQLTDFDDVGGVSVSRDGRLLAFVRAEQLYVMTLPRGEPMQLTHDGMRKGRPAFSPDGSRVAYGNGEGAVWVVPVHGGTPRQLLPNATALSWIGERQVLFSEFKKGIHLAVVTSDETRGGLRDVYVPATDQGMAHESYLSPDRRHVLVQEMDATGDLPCRVVPFDGSSQGRQVGPANAPCDSAAWSPDGRWVYLSVTVDGQRHLWRQRFPDGTPEQITFGATEELSPSAMSDGSGLVTLVSTLNRTLWIHGPGGDRRLSEERMVSLPTASRDGATLYYLVDRQRGRAFIEGELWKVDVASGQREPLMPGTAMTQYTVAPDGEHIAYTMSDEAGESSLWVARLDRRRPPRQLVRAGAYWPYYAANGTILFLAADGASKFLSRVGEEDGTVERLLSTPASYLVNVSPDGRWAVLWMPTSVEGRMSVVVQPVENAGPIVVCQPCAAWSGTMQGAPVVSWDHRQSHVFFSTKYLGGMGMRKTVAVPLQGESILPPLPADGVSSIEEFQRLPGAFVIHESDALPLRPPAEYFFLRAMRRGNAYLLRFR